MIARSRRLKLRSSGFCGFDRMKATIAIVVNVKSEMIAVPAARPSRPSLRLTPFAAPAMTTKRKTYQRGPSGMRVPVPGIRTSVRCGRLARCARYPVTAVTPARRSSFHRPDRPSERRCVNLM
jgi:hypothetical protein